MLRTAITATTFLTFAGLLTVGLARTDATHQGPDDARVLAAFGARRVSPGASMVAFRQTQFAFEAGRSLDSDWGQISLDTEHVGLRPFSRASGGYLNVILHAADGSAHWAVENLRVAPAGHRRSDHVPPARRRLELGSTQSAALPMTTHFDLRPGIEGAGRVDALQAVVLVSARPLPAAARSWDALAALVPETFAVTPSLLDAEGDLGEDGDPRVPPTGLLLLGPPPQPIVPVPEPPSGFAAPFEITQYDQPNLHSALNQCMPLALANVLGYLRIRYNAPPLSWALPHQSSPGLGQLSSIGDVVFWQPVPAISRAAQIDARTRRAGAIDFDSGSGSDRCQYLPAVFSYVAAYGTPDQIVFRHQGGSATYGEDATCDADDPLLPLGGITSTREGAQPTWTWVRDQLQAGRAVFMSFGRYDQLGARTGGHAVRIWGVRRFNGRDYFYTLDDSDQGSNNLGLRTEQWEVADNNQPGLAGAPNGRLEMGGTNWEVEFVMSAEARPTLLVQ